MHARLKIFLPRMLARHTPMEPRCRFIRRSCLEFFEISLVMMTLGARGLRFLRGGPDFLGTEDVIDLFLFERDFLGGT